VMFGRKKLCIDCKNHTHKKCNDKCDCNCQYYDEYYESMEHFERGEGWKNGGIKTEKNNPN